jgi:hypothetical protein
MKKNLVTAGAIVGLLACSPARAALVKSEMNWWPHGEIRFSHDTGDPAMRALFEEAVSRINGTFISELGPRGAPVLRLIEVPTGHSDYHLRLVKGLSCFTYNNGFDSPNTNVHIHPRCTTGYSAEGIDPVSVAMHEIMHAVGFGHELTRYDARSFTRLLTCNLQDGVRGTGEVDSPDPTSCGISGLQSGEWLADSKNEPYTLGSDYDFLSVMHYHPWATARVKEGARLQSWDLEEGVLEAVFPDLEDHDAFLDMMASRAQLSAGDIAAVRRIYGGEVSDLAVTQEATLRCWHAEPDAEGCDRIRTSMKYTVTSKGPWETSRAILNIDLPGSDIHTSGDDKYTWSPAGSCTEVSEARLRCDLGALAMFEPVEVVVSVYTKNDSGLTFSAAVAHGDDAGVEDPFPANDTASWHFPGRGNVGCSMSEGHPRSSGIPALLCLSLLCLVRRARPRTDRRRGRFESAAEHGR